MALFVSSAVFSVTSFKIAKSAAVVLDRRVIGVMYIEHVQLIAAVVQSDKVALLTRISFNALFRHVQFEMSTQARFVRSFMRTMLFRNFVKTRT